MRRAVIVVAALAVMAACSKKEPRVEATKASVAAGGPGKADARPQATPLLATAPFLKLTPAGAALVVASDGPSRLLPRLGWAQLRARVAPQLEAAAAASVKELGHDLTDPKNWPSVGVDPERPVGFAMLSEEEELFAAYVPITDAAKVEATIRNLAARNESEALKVEKVKEATVISKEGDDDVFFVLRDGYAVLVGGDAGQGRVRAQAERLAALAARDSLAEDATYKAALAGLVRGRDLGLYVDVGRFVAADRAKKARYRAGGDDGQPRKPDEDDVIIDRIFGSKIGGLAVGFDVENEAVTFGLALRLSEDAGLRKVLKNAPGIPMLVRALETAPLFGVSVQLDSRALAGILFDAIASSEGPGAVDEVKAAARAVLGMDLEADLVPMFTGEVGFALTGKLEDLLEDEPKFGGGLVVGITDEAKAKKLLDLATKLGLPTEGADTFLVPDLGKVHVGVGGGYVAFSTSDSFVKRATTKATGGLAAAAPKQALATLLQTEGAAGQMVADYGFSAFYFLIGRSARAEFASASAEPGSPSPEYLKKKAELAALDNEIQAQRDASEAEEHRHMTLLMRAVGTTAVIWRVADGGLVFEGGQYVGAPTVGDAVSAVVGEVLALEEVDARGRALEDLEEKRWKLRGELGELGGGPASIVSPVEPIPSPVAPPSAP